MAKLSINLLPPELEAEKKQRAKGTKVATLSIGFLLLVVGIAAIVLTIRVSQNVILGNLKKDLDAAKLKISSPELTNKEGTAVALKSRLDTIGNLLAQDTFSSYAFTLINHLLPSTVQLSSIAIDNKGMVRLSVESADINGLETLFNNLLDAKVNQNKITAVTLDSLGRINSGTYRVDLTITLVGGGKNKPAAAPPTK